jgi:DNA-binding transcriptional MerR regulator
MRISDLAAATAVPVHTLKYYLREGLLMAGEATSRTTADYGPLHVERVRLVRALIEQGGIGIAGVHAVLAALDSPPVSRHLFLGAAHAVLPLPGSTEPITPEVADLVRELGWAIDQECPPARALGAAIRSAREGGVPLGHEELLAYAGPMGEVALLDLAKVEEAAAAGGSAAALRLVVIGNVLLDPVLIALRRVAQEAASAAREKAGNPRLVETAQ